MKVKVRLSGTRQGGSMCPRSLGFAGGRVTPHTNITPGSLGTAGAQGRGARGGGGGRGRGQTKQGARGGDEAGSACSSTHTHTPHPPTPCPGHESVQRFGGLLVPGLPDGTHTHKLTVLHTSLNNAGEVRSLPKGQGHEGSGGDQGTRSRDCNGAGRWASCGCSPSARAGRLCRKPRGGGRGGCMCGRGCHTVTTCAPMWGARWGRRWGARPSTPEGRGGV
jgi:hypothetical protein